MERIIFGGVGVNDITRQAWQDRMNAITARLHREQSKRLATSTGRPKTASQQPSQAMAVALRIRMDEVTARLHGKRGLRIHGD